MQKKLIINFSTNMLTLIFSIVVSLWMTPFIINSLGTDSYGFIPLSQNLINIFSVLTVSLSSVIGRYFTVSYQQGELDSADIYINTYLISSIVISIIMLLPFVFISIYIDRFIQVPGELIIDVKLSIFIASLLFIITFIGSAFSVAPFSKNKLYISNGIQAINVIIRSTGIFLLLNLFSPRIWYINLATLIASVLSCLISLYYFKKLMPNIKFNLKLFDFLKLKELLSSGLWNSVGQLGILLFLQIDLLVCNLMLGASETGRYAAIMQFPMLIRTISSTIAAIFAPVIITYYAQNNIAALKNYSNQAVKYTGLLIALPAALLCGLGEPLLRTWLGQDFVELKWLLILQSVYLILTQSIMPLFHIATAVNKLKTQAIATLIFGIINLFLAIVLSPKFGLYGIALAGAIALILKNFIFTPIHIAHLTGDTFLIYYKGVLKPIIGMIFSIIIGIGIQKFFYIDNWVSFITASLIVIITYFIFVFIFLLNKDEKKKIALIGGSIGLYKKRLFH